MRGFEIKQPEGSLLNWCWGSELGQPVKALQGHPHGVARQRAEMVHQIGKAHDAQPLRVTLGGLLRLCHLERSVEITGDGRCARAALLSVSWNSSGASA